MVEADRAGEDVLDPVAGEQVEILLVDRAVTADQDGIHALGLVTVVVGQKGTDQLEVEVILVQLLVVVSIVGPPGVRGSSTHRGPRW